MKNSKKPTYIALLIGLTFLLTACNGESEQGTKAPTREMKCLEQQSQCFFDVADGYVEVLFDVNKIIAEQVFNISVNYIGVKTINKVSGYMEGVDMFMGKIPLFLEKNKGPDNKRYLNAISAGATIGNDKLTDLPIIQAFQGEVLVGSCSAEKMTWKIWLTFTDSENKTYTKMLTIVSHRS
jgi:hypothetical protein